MNLISFPTIALTKVVGRTSQLILVLAWKDSSPELPFQNVSYMFPKVENSLQG